MWRLLGRLRRQFVAGRVARSSARPASGAGMPRKAGAASKASGGRRPWGGGRAAAVKGSVCRLSLQGAGRGGAAAPRPREGPVAADAKGCVTVAVRVKPGSRQNAVTELTAEAVGVAVAAPPSDGEANAELCRYLAAVLGLRKSDVVLDKGGKSREKVVKLLAAATPEEVLQRLRAQLERE